MARCVPATAVSAAISPPDIEIDEGKYHIADVMMLYCLSLEESFPLAVSLASYSLKKTLCVFFACFS